MRSKETFILSLWVEDGESAMLRGMLQSVKSGEKQTFATVEELLVLLKTRLQQASAASIENEAVEEQNE